MNTMRIFALVAAVFSFLACSKQERHAVPVDAPASMQQRAQEPAIEAAAAEEPKVETPAPDSTALEAYVLESMTKWAPASSMPGRDVSHYPSIAKDIATVVLDPAEKSLWESDTNKGRTAIMLAGMAFFESHYWKHVDDGSCNDFAKRKTKAFRAIMAVTGDCDGGFAASLWQMHIHEVVLTADVWYYSFDSRVAGQKGLTTADIIADRRLAARAALHMLRKSINMSGGLSGYTGESGGGYPKANARFNFATNWSRKHPFK